MRLMVMPVGRSLVFSGSQVGEGNFLVQILCGGSVIGHDCEADGNAGRPQPGFFRITGKKYFVPYRSQAKNISYPTDQGITHYLSVIPLTLERSKDRLSLVYPPSSSTIP